MDVEKMIQLLQMTFSQTIRRICEQSTVLHNQSSSSGSSGSAAVAEMADMSILRLKKSPPTSTSIKAKMAAKSAIPEEFKVQIVKHLEGSNKEVIARTAPESGSYCTSVF